MNKDTELDLILASLERDKARLNDLLNPEPIEQPKPVEPPKEIEPPKPIEEAPTQKPKKNKVKKGIASYLKATFSKDIAKSAKIIVAIIVAIAIVIAGGLAIINNVKYGYIKQYEKQYGIDFPKGIQESLCNDYGKNPSIRGTLTIEGKEKYVDYKNNGNAYLDFGASIDNDQQFNTIRANKNSFNLESIYSSSNGYLSSSQEIVFNTLYEEQRYHIIACYYTNTEATNGDDYVFPFNLYGNMTKKSFVEYEDKIKSRQLYDTGYKYNYFDKFLNVAIDSDFMEGYVFVLVGVKVDEIEKSTTATDNKKIHYPQSYYDIRDEHNPYQFAKKWYPEIIVDDTATRLDSNTFAK